MNLNFNSNEENKEKKKIGKDKIRLGVLIVCILILIVNSFILADSIHTKVVTYKALGSFVSGGEINDGKAQKLGNLGNYNIVSKNNSVKSEKDGSYTLSVDLKFVNYAEKGRSFNEAVSVTAYQENEEVTRTVSAEDIFSKEETDVSDESDIKVRNGKASDVLLRFTIKDPSKDVDIVMTSGSYEFTYTVKLSESKTTETQNEETNTKQPTENK